MGGRDITDSVAKTLGILPATVARVARVLREHDPGLWPESGKGGGKAAATILPRHLVNLMLALAMADPITTAPQVATEYAGLVLRDRPYLWEHSFGETARALFADTEPASPTHLVSGPRSVLRGMGDEEGGLGADLVRLINLLAGADRERIRAALVRDGFTVSMTSDALIPRAEIRFWSTDMGRAASVVQTFYGPRQSPLERLRDVPGAQTPFSKTIAIPASFFCVLADLWIEMQSRRTPGAPVLPLASDHGTEGDVRTTNPDEINPTDHTATGTENDESRQGTTPDAWTALGHPSGAPPASAFAAGSAA